MTHYQTTEEIFFFVSLCLPSIDRKSTKPIRQFCGHSAAPVNANDYSCAMVVVEIRQPAALCVQQNDKHGMTLSTSYRDKTINITKSFKNTWKMIRRREEVWTAQLLSAGIAIGHYRTHTDHRFLSHCRYRCRVNWDACVGRTHTELCPHVCIHFYQQPQIGNIDLCYWHLWIMNILISIRS